MQIQLPRSRCIRDDYLSAISTMLTSISDLKIYQDIISSLPLYPGPFLYDNSMHTIHTCIHFTNARTHATRPGARVT